jgi:hypothetical protein
VAYTNAGWQLCVVLYVLFDNYSVVMKNSHACSQKSTQLSNGGLFRRGKTANASTIIPSDR